jgi:AcrR family transcriptional regulator
MARNGAGFVNLRDVAKELGCSIGVLTYQFTNKEELFLFTWRYLVGELFSDALSAGGHGSSIEQLERILVAALPTTTERRERWRQWIAFLGVAIASGVMLDEERKSNERFIVALSEILEECVADNKLPAGLKIKAEAQALMSLVDGLGIDAVLHPELYTGLELKRIVKRYLARMTAANR